MNLNPISQEWRCRHVFADIVLGGFASVVIAAVVINYIPPAWAVSVPIGNLFVIDLGDLPPWIGAMVAFAIWWDARKAKKNAAEAAALAASGVQKLSELNTKVDGVLADRDKGNVIKGEKKEQLVGERVAAALAEGQIKGKEAERESAAAAVTPASPTHAPIGSPLPVADDKNTKASERVAAATERMADATEVKADKK